jgi:hypothetical protein
MPSVRPARCRLRTAGLPRRAQLRLVRCTLQLAHLGFSAASVERLLVPVRLRVGICCVAGGPPLRSVPVYFSGYELNEPHVNLDELSVLGVRVDVGLASLVFAVNRCQEDFMNGSQTARRHIPWFAVLVCLQGSLLPAPLSGQGVEVPRPGDRVRVQWVDSLAAIGPQRSVGRVVSVSADSIVLRSARAVPLSVAQSQILKLEIGRQHRGRSAAEGAAWGAALFGAAGLLFAAILTSDNRGVDGEAALVLGGAGALAGAAVGSTIGLAVPDTKWTPAELPRGSQSLRR